jgi:hypothetical protein
VTEGEAMEGRREGREGWRAYFVVSDDDELEVLLLRSVADDSRERMS